MPTQEILITLIAIAVVIFAIARQVMPQQVRRLGFIVLPALAAYESYRSLPTPNIPVSQMVECLLVVLAALVAGSIQAAFTRVYYHGNRLYMRGGMVSLIAWVALMLVRSIIGLIFQGTSLFTSFNNFEWMLWAAIAVAFGSRNAILYMKHPEIGEALAGERANRRQRNDR